MKTFLTVLSVCVFLNLRYSSKYFPQIYRAHYGAAMHVCVPPSVHHDGGRIMV